MGDMDPLYGLTSAYLRVLRVEFLPSAWRRQARWGRVGVTPARLQLIGKCPSRLLKNYFWPAWAQD